MFVITEKEKPGSGGKKKKKKKMRGRREIKPYAEKKKVRMVRM